MLRSRFGLPLLAAALLSGGCAVTTTTPAGAPPAAPTGQTPAPAEAVDTDAAAAGERAVARDQELAAALERAVADAGDWPSLHMFTECRRDAGLESVEIFGNGVAIRDGKRQFEVPGTTIAALLGAFQEADFAGMPTTFGGKKKPEDLEAPPRPPGDGEAIGALRVICRVELSVGGESKMVAQLDEGEQSETLRELSEEFFRLTDEPARAGITATDLADGLARIGRGELAPETLHLMLHRRPETGEPEEGFLLRLDGLRATTRPVGASGGAGAVRALVLSPDDLRALARELSGLEPGRLPINLWAAHYTDFTVEVLGHKHSVQARQFAGMEPTTHGDLQQSFDRLYERLRDLDRRVRADGAARAE